MIVNIPSWDVTHSVVSICYTEEEVWEQKDIFLEYWILVKG